MGGMAAKLAFSMSLAMLNVYFAWSSHLLRVVSPRLYEFVSRPIRLQDFAVWRYYDLAKFTTYTLVVSDFEALILLLVVMAGAAWLSSDRGRWFALMRAVQVAALCLVVFGVELGLFDYHEFYVHVTDAQLTFNFVPWFTNADMLVSAAAILAMSTLIGGRLQSHPATGKETPPPHPPRAGE
jgi:hypothetical protein